MEQKIKILDFRKDDATMENTKLAMHTFSSSKASKNWEKISEDWVSLFLDPAISDKTLPLDFESYLQSNSNLSKASNHFSLQDLLANSLLLHSTDDQLSYSDMTLGSSLNVIEDLFEKEDSSLLVDLIHPKDDPLGHNNSILPASILTQISKSSCSEMEVDSWKDKEVNLDLSMMLKQETNAKVSFRFNSPTPPSTIATNASSGFSSNLAKNTLQSSSYLLQCEEGEIKSCDVELEAISTSDSIAQVEIPSIVSQSKIFGVRHLQSIGNAIKVGLIRRSRDKGINNQYQKNCEVELFKLQNQKVLKDKQSEHKDGDKKQVAGDEGNEKRQVRLMHNCKSAQLSKKQKMVYVDELEDKLQIMATNIVDLNITINHLTAENVNLQRQLRYYCLFPGVCSRLGMPIHVMPIGPFSRPATRTLTYSSGQMLPISIPHIKTQLPTRNSKRPKSRVTKEGSNKKQTKFKAASFVSMVVMGFIFVFMLFGFIDQGLNGSNVIDDYTQVENVQVEGRLLTNWSEHLNLLNSTKVNLWEPGSSWLPLEPGEYGPERKGITNVHTQLVTKKLQFKTTKSQGITKVGFESFVQHSIDGNATLATSTSPNYFNSIKNLLLMDSKAVLNNTSQSFEASVFIPGADNLVKVDRNLIIQALMVGDKATKKYSEKKHKSRSKKKKIMKQFAKTSFKLQAMKSLPIKALDNLTSKELKVLKNSTIGPFVTNRHLLKNLNSIIEANNPILPMLRVGSLQQWIFGTLHDPKTNSVARKLTKKTKSQLPVNKSKVVPATQETFYSFIPYDAAPRGPLNSWLFSSLSTEPIICKRNISNNVKEAMHLSIIKDERFENLMPFWVAMQPLAYNQLFQKKAHKVDTCSVPTLNKLFWATTTNIEPAKAVELQQCLTADGPMLNTTMYIEFFQFNKAIDTSPQQAPNFKAKNMAKSMAIKVAQGNLHNVTSTISIHVVPHSQWDPFTVPLLPVKPKPNSTNKVEDYNRTNPRVEEAIQEQMLNQNLRHGVSSMVVSVIVGPKEYGDSRIKETKGLSRIFVVVLINNQKYMTYSCMLPSGEFQAHDAAE